MLDAPAGESLAIRVAWLTGLAALGASVVSLTATVIIRAIGQTRRRWARRAAEVWRPLFSASLAGADPAPMRLARRDRIPVLVLWNHLRESVRGEAATRLVGFARAAGFDAIAREMLERGSAGQRLVAITTAGNCGDESAWSLLLRQTEDSSPVAAHAASKAMIRIHPRAAAIALAPRLLKRTDWHPSRVIALLDAAGPEHALPSAVSAARTAPEGDLPRLFAYLAATESHTAVSPILERLAQCRHPDAIAAGLRALIALHADAEPVRHFTEHPSEAVRVQAAAALGALGGRSDVETLTSMLADPAWWVRHRAARSLAGFPFMTVDDLESIAAAHPDRYARDALQHVIAERRLRRRR